MADNKIIIRNRVSGFTLVGFWFLVLFIPALMLNLSLEALFDFTMQRNSQFHRNGLINEMEMFRRAVEVESFIQRISAEFFSRKNMQIADMRGEELANEFKMKYQFSPDVVLINSITSNAEHNFYMSETFKERSGLVGRAFLKKYMQSRHLMKRLGEKSFLQAKIEDQTRIESQIKKQILDSDLFLQRQFGLIAALPLLPGHAVSSISSKMKSRLIFYFHHSGENSPDVLFIFRAAKIRPDELFKNSFSPADAKIVRSIVRRRTPIDDSKNVSAEKLTFFYSDQKGLNLVSTLPQTLVSHIVQAGRFFPAFLPEFCARMMLLRVTVPVKILEHPLKKYAAAIYACSRFLCLAGAVFCLYVYLFGFKFKASVRFKAIVGIVLITWVPFIMMVAAYFTWLEIDTKSKNLQTAETLARIANDLQLKFDSFLLKEQRKTLLLAEKTSAVMNRSRNDLIRYLSENLKNSLAREAFYFSRDGERILVKNPEAFYAWKNDRDENFFMRLLAGLLLQAATFDHQIARNFTGNYEEQGLYRPEPKLVNIILNNRGRLLTFKAFNGNYVYATSTVTSNSGTSNFSLLSLRFDKRKLIEKFVENFSAADFYRGLTSIERAEIQFVTYREELGKFDFFPLNGRQKLEGLVDALEMVAAGQRSSSFFCNGRQIVMNYIPDYPMIIVCKSKTIQDSFSYKSIIFNSLYAFLLLIFIYRLFGRFYVAPVSLLAQAAKKVKEGDYSFSLEIPQGDEFFQVKQSFDAMVQGVMQKERLFEFVSDDVIDAVRSDEEKALLPGGEKLEAAIVFVALNDFNQGLGAKDARELLAQLEFFIFQGNQITRKYGGVLDKVIEDTLMLVFRKGKGNENMVVAACNAVIELRCILAQAGMKISAGIANGEIVSGKIGSSEGKLDFTVIGDAVNLAARLKGQAQKLLDSGIILSADSIRKAGGKVRAGFVDRVKIKGKASEYQIFELLEIR